MGSSQSKHMTRVYSCDVADGVCCGRVFWWYNMDHVDRGMDIGSFMKSRFRGWYVCTGFDGS